MNQRQPMKENNEIKVKMDLPGTIFFLLLAGYILFTANTFPKLDWKLGGSPAFYPRILAVLLIIFSVGMYVKSRKYPKSSVFPGPRKGFYMLFCFTACLVMPVFLLPLLGFRISSFIFMFIILLISRGGEILRVSDYLKLALSSFLISGIVYGAFTHLARVRLPLGSLTGW